MPLIQQAQVIIQVLIDNHLLSPYQCGLRKFNQGGVTNMELQWFRSFEVFCSVH